MANCIDCGITTKGRGSRCNSCAQKKRWADPKNRKKQSEAAKLACMDPETRQRKSNAARKVWVDPETRQKISEALKASYADPERKRRHLEAMRRPNARQKISDAALQSYEDDSELKQRVSDGVKAAWDRGAYDNRVPVGNPSKLELSVLEALKNYGLECED